MIHKIHTIILLKLISIRFHSFYEIFCYYIIKVII